MLFAEGHTILQRPEHGPHEHGKDVVTRSKQGLYAFQLKAGDIGTSEWREISGEIDELVEVPLAMPLTNRRFQPTLVTSGRVKEPVRRKIELKNRGWVRRGFRQLQLIDGDALLSRFRAVQGAFLPSALHDVNLFLGLFLADGHGPINAASLSQFMESVLPLGKEVRTGARRAAFASGPMLASMVLAPYSRTSNHFEEACGWTIVIAHLLAVAEGVGGTEWGQSVQLALGAYESCMERLLAEVLGSRNWLSGNALVDAPFIDSRRQLVLGSLCAYAVYRRARGTAHHLEDDLFAKLLREFTFVPFCGECLAPALYSALLLLWIRGQERDAVRSAARVVEFLVDPPKPDFLRGVPDPYHPPQACLSGRLAPNGAGAETEFFAGRSFSSRSFVEFMVRRNWRRDLKRLWLRLTENTPAEFVPNDRTGLYRWHCQAGALRMGRWRQPEYWGTLAQEAWSKETPVLLLFNDYPEFLLPFAIAFPHRFTPALARAAETALIRAGQISSERGD